jgi:hypothetical protein
VKGIQKMGIQMDRMAEGHGGVGNSPIQDGGVNRGGERLGAPRPFLWVPAIGNGLRL